MFAAMLGAGESDKGTTFSPPASCYDTVTSAGLTTTVATFESGVSAAASRVWASAGMVLVEAHDVSNRTARVAAERHLDVMFAP